MSAVNFELPPVLHKQDGQEGARWERPSMKDKPLEKGQWTYRPREVAPL
jgi:hypothetical protein